MYVEAVESFLLLLYLHPQFSPGAFVGSIITYEYRGKMYQAKTIKFQLGDL